jgi:hypothetical protein
VTEQIKFEGDPRWWTVRASDERFIVLTRTAAFGRGITYTIIDKERGVRGPCNLIGQGWNFNPDSLDYDGQRLLDALQRHVDIERRLEAGERSISHDEPAVEVSYRNNVPVRIAAKRHTAQAGDR